MDAISTSGEKDRQHLVDLLRVLAIARPDGRRRRSPAGTAYTRCAAASPNGPRTSAPRRMRPRPRRARWAVRRRRRACPSVKGRTALPRTRRRRPCRRGSRSSGFPPCLCASVSRTASSLPPCSGTSSARNHRTDHVHHGQRRRAPAGIGMCGTCGASAPRRPSLAYTSGLISTAYCSPGNALQRAPRIVRAAEHHHRRDHQAEHQPDLRLPDAASQQQAARRPPAAATSTTTAANSTGCPKLTFSPDPMISHAAGITTSPDDHRLNHPGDDLLHRQPPVLHRREQAVLDLPGELELGDQRHRDRLHAREHHADRDDPRQQHVLVAPSASCRWLVSTRPKTNVNSSGCSRFCSSMGSRLRRATCPSRASMAKNVFQFNRASSFRCGAGTTSPGSAPRCARRAIPTPAACAAFTIGRDQRTAAVRIHVRRRIRPWPAPR